jgi:hypothetical protein
LGYPAKGENFWEVYEIFKKYRAEPGFSKKTKESTQGALRVFLSLYTLNTLTSPGTQVAQGFSGGKVRTFGSKGERIWEMAAAKVRTFGTPG